MRGHGMTASQRGKNGWYDREAHNDATTSAFLVVAQPQHLKKPCATTAEEGVFKKRSELKRRYTLPMISGVTINPYHPDVECTIFG